jgi:hypothetical protein
MPEYTEDNDLLNMLEELSRCAAVSIAGVESLMLGAARIDTLKALVKQYRPVPYHYQGGRRYRGAICIDPPED